MPAEPSGVKGFAVRYRHTTERGALPHAGACAYSAAMERIHVIGATGRSGAALARALLAAGREVVPVVRNRAKWEALGFDISPRTAVLGHAPAALAEALADATCVVSCAHARYTAAILAAAPLTARLVLLGSTRRYSQYPDGHGVGVQAGETAFLASRRPGVMLHPTMIYGAEGEDNVRRLAALMRRLPFVPLPGGGRNLVQPIHQDDLTRCIVAAIDIAWTGAQTLIVAGPAPVRYADFARAVAAAAGLRMPRIVSVPAWLLMALVPLTRLPFVPRIRRDEVRRLLEDKAFAIDDMTHILGVTPMPLAEGLARTFTSATP
jgi:nucleoside-diphosphate-sugar epimerase